MKSGFKHAISWNKYQSKITTQATSQCIDNLIDPIFQGVTRLFALSFENINSRTGHTEYFFITREVKNYNVMIDGKNFFDQPVKNKLRTCDNILKIEQVEEMVT